MSLKGNAEWKGFPLNDRDKEIDKQRSMGNVLHFLVSWTLSSWGPSMSINFSFLKTNLARLNVRHRELVERCALLPGDKLQKSEINWLTSIYIWLNMYSGSVEDRKLPGFDVEPPVAPVHPDFISVTQGGQEVAIFHRNGMGPAKALHLALKTGLLDGNEHTDEEASTLASRYDVVRIPLHQEVGFDVKKLPKTKGATAPTTAQMAADISRMLTYLQIAPELRPVPALNSQAKALLIELVQISEERKAEDPTPATSKQIEFAEKLSVERGVELPDKRTRYNLSRFIDHALTLPFIPRQAMRVEPPLSSSVAAGGADLRIFPAPYPSDLVCLHDEKGTSTKLGRGTHYSVFECPKSGSSAGCQRLAVIWDEDHDVRVLDVVDRLRSRGLLSDVLFVGERKGAVTFILDPHNSVTRQNLSAIHRYSSTVGQDHWEVTVGFFDGKFKNSEAAYIVHDDPELVRRYLVEIREKWDLGHRYGDGEGR
jgi:hypothetical protein